MSGSRWVITPSWLSGSWRSFFYSSSVYSCHLFLSSAAVRSISFLFFIVPFFSWNVSSVANFLEEISSLSHSIVFLYLHWSLRKALLSLLALLWNSSPLSFASLLFAAICKASSEKHVSFLHFFFLGMVLILASYIMSQISIHSSSGTLSDLIIWIYFSLPVYNCKVFDLGLLEWSSGFPYFFQFKSEFSNKEFMIWGTVSTQSCFCWLYRASPCLAAKNIINLILVLTIWWCPCVESSLVCWKKVFAMTSAFSWQKPISLWPVSFCTPRPNLPVTPGVSWPPIFAFQSPIMKRTSFLDVGSRKTCRSS